MNGYIGRKEKEIIEGAVIKVWSQSKVFQHGRLQSTFHWVLLHPHNFLQEGQVSSYMSLRKRATGWSDASILKDSICTTPSDEAMNKSFDIELFDLYKPRRVPLYNVTSCAEKIGEVLVGDVFIAVLNAAWCGGSFWFGRARGTIERGNTTIQQFCAGCS